MRGERETATQSDGHEWVGLVHPCLVVGEF